MSNLKRRGSFYILLAALLWSTGGLFIKDVTLDGFGVSLWRSTFASITLYVIYRFTFSKQQLAEQRRHWLASHTIIMATIYAALLVLFVLATKLTTSANAIFLQYTAPIYVLFFEPFISKTKVKRADIISVAVTISAMGLFFIGKFDTSSTLGNILALTSGVCFAAYALLLKHEKTGESVRWQSVIVGHVIIVASMLVMWLIGAMDPTVHSTKEASELIFLGVLQIGVAYSLFTTGIHYVRALDALLLSMVEPVLNPVWVFIGIGETPTGWAIIGGMIILAISAIRTYREGMAT
jgi:DME family drug/metabolite transporter